MLPVDGGFGITQAFAGLQRGQPLLIDKLQNLPLTGREHQALGDGFVFVRKGTPADFGPHGLALGVHSQSSPRAVRLSGSQCCTAGD